MLIGLTGYAGSGKDTVADILVRDHGFKRYAFADKMREALLTLNPFVEECGLSLQDILSNETWDEAKRRYPEVRELLQRFGTEVGRAMFGEDFWVDLVARQIEDELPWGSNVVMTDVRFANEANWVYHEFGTVLRITRPGVGPANDHSSEKLSFSAAFEITNDRDIPHLASEVATLLKRF
jgi:enamine deaminase RidA (YjgF/YER057c/UK114 family)